MVKKKLEFLENKSSHSNNIQTLDIGDSMKLKNSRRSFWSWPWHVALIALVFPLLLYANNLGEVTLASLWRPLAFSLLAGLILFGLCYWIFKNIQEAGLITGILEILFFSYGHIYNLLKSLRLFGHLIGRHRYLFPIFIALVGWVIWRVIKRKSSLSEPTLLLNIVTLGLFVVQLVRISSFEIKSYQEQRVSGVTGGTVITNTTFEKRDIYIILLDGYMRSDWLADSIGFDNSGFLAELEDLGFSIVPCSMSNYPYTRLSMTSELNMNYLDQFFDPLSDIETSTLLKHSEVRTIFEGLGYDTVFFQVFFPWLNINDGDYYFKPEDVSKYDPFEVLYLQTTLLTMPYDLFERQIAETKWSLAHEDTTRYATLIQSIFDYLQQPHDYDNPVFVYAHIISPHSPFVFNADGSINYEWEEDKAASQLETYQYLNIETIKTIESILANSNTDPIIILQSDHGMGQEAYRDLSLNALYLPEGGEQMLYPTITPVNFFRMIFDYYFDMDYGLVEDKRFYSENDNPYDLHEVQDPYDYCRDND